MSVHVPKGRIEQMQLYKLIPETTAGLLAIDKAVRESGLEQSLIELVKTRASQINGCAFCINMHSADAQKHGETTERLLLLDAWREAPVYTDRERAGLAWTEALTLVTQGHVPDAVFEEASQHFSEAELASLTSLVITINAWNRVAIAYRFTPQIKAAS